MGHPVHPPCRSRVTHSRLHSTTSRRVLKISREGDSTASLGSLCQGSITLRVKRFFLMFRRIFLCFRLCPQRPRDTLLLTTGPRIGIHTPLTVLLASWSCPHSEICNAPDDRSVQKHCSGSWHATNQQPEQMERKSPSKGRPGGCRHPALKA